MQKAGQTCRCLREEHLKQMEKKVEEARGPLCVFEEQQESQRGWSVIRESVETKVEMETGARCYGIS